MIRALLALCLLVLAAGCDPTYHVRLDDGGGLTEGAPVLVSNVQVGEIEAVRVVEGQVDVTLTVGRDHALTVREDTCAVPVQGRIGPALAIHAGQGAPVESDTIPPCRPSSADVDALARELGASMGQLLRGVTEGMLGGAQP